MLSLLVTVGFGILAAQAGVCWALVRSLRATPLPIAAPDPAPARGPDRPPAGVSREEFEPYALKVAQLELAVAQLPKIWTEEADRAFRSAERAEKAGKRSRKKSEVEEEPEPDQLSHLDAEGGGASGLQPMPAGMAGPADGEAMRALARRQIALQSISGGN